MLLSRTNTNSNRYLDNSAATYILQHAIFLTRYSGTAEKTDMRVKRRWDDDVVFKNCSRAAPEKKEANFINDSLRSEFHRKFMNKYIK